MSRNNSGLKSVYEDIPEPLRLEWLIALLTAKIYGAKYVKPNLTLDQKGLPKSYASGGMADIEFITEKLYCLIEVTLQRDYKQQENNETTSISSHLRELKTDIERQSILIAPRIHDRVVDYFRFCSKSYDLIILATTIEKFIHIVTNNNDIDSYINAIKEEMTQMSEKSLYEYTDMINGFKIEK